MHVAKWIGLGSITEVNFDWLGKEWLNVDWPLDHDHVRKKFLGYRISSLAFGPF
jgi:hypothetical protein